MPNLLYEIAADGSVTDRPIALLGPDVRETGDGLVQSFAWSHSLRGSLFLNGYLESLGS